MKIGLHHKGAVPPALLGVGLVLFGLSVALTPSRAEARCFHFCRAQIAYGVGFGGLWSGEGSSFLANVHGDYYLLDGLSAGVEVRYLSDPRYLLPELSLRYTPFLFLEWNTVPFLAIKGGRTFSIDADGDAPDQNTVAAGGGIAYFITPFVALRVSFSRRFFEKVGAAEIEGGIVLFLD